MKKLLALLLCLVITPAYAQKSPGTLTTEVNTNLPDNTTGLITPAIVRSTLIDIIDSYYNLLGDSAGHIRVPVQATPPALTSCGGGSPSISGTDVAGQVTMGTSATGCIITFNQPYTNSPYCTVYWIATPLASQSSATVATGMTLTQTSTSGNKVIYHCLAQSGG